MLLFYIVNVTLIFVYFHSHDENNHTIMVIGYRILDLFLITLIMASILNYVLKRVISGVIQVDDNMFKFYVVMYNLLLRLSFSLRIPYLLFLV
jgi:hypothetical protein